MTVSRRNIAVVCVALVIPVLAAQEATPSDSSVVSTPDGSFLLFEPNIQVAVALDPRIQDLELIPHENFLLGRPIEPGPNDDEPEQPVDPPQPAEEPGLAVPTPPPPTAAEIGADRRWPQSAAGVVSDAQVIAYYGHPNSRFMGILGEQSIETMAATLLSQAAEYDRLNGDIGVAPAFHLIYGTVYEDATVGIINQEKLQRYIDYAGDNGILVFLDHQIGNGTVEGAISMMLPFLRYPHVHLAFDPEWATDLPGKEIGHVTAQDVNLAQQMMQDYLIDNDLPGERMLVVHQFNWRMITQREDVRADYSRIQLIHNADGFGAPAMKRVSWRANVEADNIPLKGFKLFYPKSWRDGGYDDPLLTPAEVLLLDPVPVYVQYQ